MNTPSSIEVIKYDVRDAPFDIKLFKKNMFCYHKLTCRTNRLERTRKNLIKTLDEDVFFIFRDTKMYIQHNTVYFYSLLTKSANHTSASTIDYLQQQIELNSIRKSSYQNESARKIFFYTLRLHKLYGQLSVLRHELKQDLIALTYDSKSKKFTHYRLVGIQTPFGLIQKTSLEDSAYSQYANSAYSHYAHDALFMSNPIIIDITDLLK